MIIVVAVGVGVYLSDVTSTTAGEIRATGMISSSSYANSSNSSFTSYVVQNTIPETKSSITSTQCRAIGNINFSIPTGNAALAAITYDSHESKLYAAGTSFNYFGPSQSNFTYVVDLGDSTQIVANTSLPTDVVYDPDNNNVYVANFGSNSVSVINDTTNEIISSIKVGTGPIRIAYDPFNHEIYVSNRLSGTVSVINATSNKVLSNIKVSISPFELAYDSLNHEMYVTDGSTSNVTIIDSTSNKVVGSFSIGSGSGIIVYDSANSYLYFFPQTSGTLYIIDSATNKIVANLSNIYDLNAIGYDPLNQDVYAAGNASSGFLHVISGANNSIVSTIDGENWIPVDFAYAHGSMFLTSNYGDEIFALSSIGRSGATCQIQPQTTTIVDTTNVVYVTG